MTNFGHELEDVSQIAEYSSRSSSYIARLPLLCEHLHNTYEENNSVTGLMHKDYTNITVIK